MFTVYNILSGALIFTPIILYLILSRRVSKKKSRIIVGGISAAISFLLPLRCLYDDFCSGWGGFVVMIGFIFFIVQSIIFFIFAVFSSNINESSKPLV